MKKLYALEKSILSDYLSNSRELRAAARGMTAEDMRKAVSEIMAGASVNKNQIEIDEEGAAHIPIVGMLTEKAGPCDAFFGPVTEYGYIREKTLEAEQDERVSKIIFDVDSGGGYVDGVDLTAQVIAGVSKPTEARVYNLAASAAYWLASQTDKIIAMTPAAQVGSIGVASEEFDDDEKLKQQGITHRIYTSTDAPDKRPDTKTEEGQQKIISMLDDVHNVFVLRVAEGRDVSPKKVKDEFGKGGIVIASNAIKAGMIDEIKGESISRKQEPKKKEIKMDLQTLKTESPETYKAALEEGKALGVSEERARREALVALKGSNADGDRAIEEAITSGKPYAEATPLIVAAIAKGACKNADGDNPPNVVTAEIKTVSGVSDTDREWFKKHGLTEAQIEEFGRSK